MTAGDKHMAKRLAEVENDRMQAKAVADVRRAIDAFLGADSAASVVVDGEAASSSSSTEATDVEEADVDKKWPKYMFRAT